MLKVSEMPVSIGTSAVTFEVIGEGAAADVG